MRHHISEDELALLYREIGEYIWNRQYLEDVLRTFLTLKIELKKPGIVSAKEAKDLLARHRRAILGASLRTAESKSALPQELIDQLKLLKEERDWLVHRSMHQDGRDLYTDSGRDIFFNRLSAI